MSTPPQGQNPFAQQGQNPYAQPQGQAPQQPGFPQQGAAPYAPVPPTPPARRFNKKVLRIAGFIVVAILIAGGKWFFGQSDAETTSVGNCLHNEGTQTSPDLKTVDCSSSDAEFEVVGKFDDTSDTDKCNAVKETEVAYYQTGDSSHEVVLCLKEVK
ncbi:hypothetical protein BN159_4542 [Streptomyces davaonensis JCM 4913]|uniref:Uncharacterized protein n=1 Tax=Streptomyces davaonensis (strain DSM 101723 / JCM 4913 / KCC S-0913 / 768) TaxID=1214101 RepID=K4QY00_STRDJ|nr:hypothetical protein [Streptomyces davaonensis]CCK28921.1 hypothetical protein BN159_4542 [Streptomyces davaonensis JCM 4913]